MHEWYAGTVADLNPADATNLDMGRELTGSDKQSIESNFLFLFLFAKTARLFFYIEPV